MSLIIGLAFALAGLLLLMTQVMVVDFARIYCAAAAAVYNLFNHDTMVFPDHVAEDQPFKYPHELPDHS